MKAVFEEGNLKLHLLSVIQAITHLTEIANRIVRLDNFSNINLIDSITALQSERDELIQNNAAYAEAWEILSGIIQQPYQLPYRLPTDYQPSIASNGYLVFFK